MARAAIEVSSQHEGDAVKLTLGHPAIKAASVITGLLLQIPSYLRPQVMHVVETQLVLAACNFDEPPEPVATPHEPGERLRLLDGSERAAGE